MHYFSLIGDVKLPLGDTDIRALECGSLLRQVEVMGELALQYLGCGKRVVVVAQDARSKRLAQQYLQRKTNLKTASYIRPIEQKEGVFFDLILRFALRGWRSVDLMALLQSGFCFLGLSQSDFEECSYYLERVVLQSRAPAHSVEILAEWTKKYAADPPGPFAAFSASLLEVLARLEKLGGAKGLSLKDFWSEHKACASILAGRDTWCDNSRIFVDFVARCNAQLGLEIAVSFDDYRFLMTDALRSDSNASLFCGNGVDNNWDIVICNLAEARCLGPGVFIVMDFAQENFRNEQFQPALLSMEARDFLNSLTTPNNKELENFLSLFYYGQCVYLLCSVMQQASPWLEDISDYERLNKRREFVTASSYVSPCPCPPLEMRPKILSVTQLQSFLNNPYGFYVESILGLKKTENLDCIPGKADTGVILHRLLDEIVSKRQDLMTEGEIDCFIQRAIETRFGYNPEAAERSVFLLPKIRKMVANFIKQNNNRSQSCSKIFTEISGQMRCVVGDYTVTLTTRCDRIEVCADRRAIRIIDYKTGAIPSKSRFAAGQDLQLPVAALIAMEGGFVELGAAREIDSLAYWDLNNDVFKIMMNGFDENFLLKIRNQITCLLFRYLDAKSSFTVTPRSQRLYVAPEHDHLARIEEENIT